MSQHLDGQVGIAQTYNLLAGVYALPNALGTPRHERYEFLTASCADLSRCCRKRRQHLYPTALAQAYAWFMSLAEELFRSSGGVFLAVGMGEKYPAGNCGYCGQLPCRCDATNRPPHVGATCSDQQRDWSLRQWQAHQDRLYGDNNRAKGIDHSLNRLSEEVAEVGLVLNHADGFNEQPEEMARRIAREMSDVLAWIFTTAILLEVDLEDAVIALYSRGCPVCRAPRCKCRPFEKMPHNGKRTHRFISAEDIYQIVTK